MPSSPRFFGVLVGSILAVLVVAGCSGPSPRPATGAPPGSAKIPRPDTSTRIDLPAPELAEEVVLSALSLIGVPYRWGGSTPHEGLDCSGLVQWVYRGSANLILPRRSEEMMSQGQPIAVQSLRAGDLVFFNTMQRPGSHVGIYIGQGRFVHAPNSRGVVRIESIEQSYWASRFDGARRFIPDRSEPLAADRREP